MKIKPMNIEVFQTENSTYEFMTSPTALYRRNAIVEQGVESHRLVYGEWLPLASYQVVEFHGSRCLHIMAADSVHGIVTSPLVEKPEAERQS